MLELTLVLILSFVTLNASVGGASGMAAHANLINSSLETMADVLPLLLGLFESTEEFLSIQRIAMLGNSLGSTSHPGAVDG